MLPAAPGLSAHGLAPAARTEMGHSEKGYGLGLHLGADGRVAAEMLRGSH